MHPLNCFLGMKKKSRKIFYIAGDCGLDETISPYFYETGNAPKTWINFWVQKRTANL